MKRKLLSSDYNDLEQNKKQRHDATTSNTLTQQEFPFSHFHALVNAIHAHHEAIAINKPSNILSATILLTVMANEEEWNYIVYLQHKCDELTALQYRYPQEDNAKRLKKAQEELEQEYIDVFEAYQREHPDHANLLVQIRTLLFDIPLEQQQNAEWLQQMLTTANALLTLPYPSQDIQCLILALFHAYEPLKQFIYYRLNPLDLTPLVLGPIYEFDESAQQTYAVFHQQIVEKLIDPSFRLQISSSKQPTLIDYHAKRNVLINPHKIDVTDHYSNELHPLYAINAMIQQLLKGDHGQSLRRFLEAHVHGLKQDRTLDEIFVTLTTHEKKCLYHAIFEGLLSNITIQSPTIMDTFLVEMAKTLDQNSERGKYTWDVKPIYPTSSPSRSSFNISYAYGRVVHFLNVNTVSLSFFTEKMNQFLENVTDTNNILYPFLPYLRTNEPLPASLSKKIVRLFQILGNMQEDQFEILARSYANHAINETLKTFIAENNDYILFFNYLTQKCKSGAMLKATQYPKKIKQPEDKLAELANKQWLEIFHHAKQIILPMMNHTLEGVEDWGQHVALAMEHFLPTLRRIDWTDRPLYSHYNYGHDFDHGHVKCNYLSLYLQQDKQPPSPFLNGIREAYLQQYLQELRAGLHLHKETYRSNSLISAIENAQHTLSLDARAQIEDTLITLGMRFDTSELTENPSETKDSMCAFVIQAHVMISLARLAVHAISYHDHSQATIRSNDTFKGIVANRIIPLTNAILNINQDDLKTHKIWQYWNDATYLLETIEYELYRITQILDNVSQLQSVDEWKKFFLLTKSIKYAMNHSPDDIVKNEHAINLNTTTLGLYSKEVLANMKSPHSDVSKLMFQKILNGNSNLLGHFPSQKWGYSNNNLEKIIQDFFEKTPSSEWTQDHVIAYIHFLQNNTHSYNNKIHNQFAKSFLIALGDHSLTAPVDKRTNIVSLLYGFFNEQNANIFYNYPILLSAYQEFSTYVDKALLMERWMRQCKVHSDLTQKLHVALYRESFFYRDEPKTAKTRDAEETEASQIEQTQIKQAPTHSWQM